jgi:hypothetical protein
VWGCAFFVFAAAAWVGFCWLKRPPYLVPDTSAFATGDVFFSVTIAFFKLPPLCFKQASFSSYALALK